MSPHSHPQRILGPLTLLTLLYSTLAEEIIKINTANVVVSNNYANGVDRFGLEIGENLIGEKFIAYHVESNDTVEIFDGPKENMQRLCTGVGKLTCVLLLKDVMPLMKSPEGYRISIQDQNRFLKTNYKLAVEVGNFIKFDGNTLDRVHMKGIDDLDMMVAVKPEAGHQKMRFQIEAETSQPFALIDAFVNFQKATAPSESSNDFKLLHLDSLRLGYMLDNQNANFCIDAAPGLENTKECQYRINIRSTKVHAFNLNIQQVPKIEAITTDIKYFDHLPARGHRVYKLELPEHVLNSNDIKISLVTTQGRANLYANPQFIPEFSRKCFWQAEQGITKSIVITKAERDTKIQNMSVIFISVEALVTSSFYLKVVARTSQELIEELEEGTRETVFSPYDTVKNFEIKYKRYGNIGEIQPETTIAVNMHSNNAYVELFGYHRLKGTDPILTFSDVTSEAGRKSFNKFVAQTGSHEEKTIKITFVCDQLSAMSSHEVSKGIVLYECSLMIGVLPLNKMPSYKQIGESDAQRAIEQKGATYEISYHVEGAHTILHMNRFSVFRLAPDERRLLMFGFNGHLIDEVDGLEFNYQGMYGQVDIIINPKVRDPCSPEAEIGSLKKTISGTQHQKVVFGSNDIAVSDLRGTYYVCIRASNVLSSVGITVKPINSKSIHTSDVQLSLQHIPPNQNMIGELVNPQFPLRFSFHANMDSSNEEYITINLNRISGPGKYRIVVSNNGMTPNPSQNYWNVVSDTLTIHSTDKMFKKSAQYIVAVYLLAGVGSQGSVHKFSISYNYGNVHTLLKEGEQFSTILEPKLERRAFRIEIPSKAKELMFLKTVIAGKCATMISFDEKNQFPIPAKSDIAVPPANKGFHLDEESLKKYCPKIETENCHMYLVLQNWEANTKVNLAYTTGRVPITLHDHTYMDLPTFMNGGTAQSWHFVYHIPVELRHNFTLSCENIFNPFICYMKFVKGTEEFVFPTESSNSLKLNASNRYLEIKEADYGTADTMLITVTSGEAPGFFHMYNKGLNYHFVATGRISLVSNTHHLHIGQRKKFTNEARTWQYFKIYHRSHENIDLNIESYSGFCWIAVWKDVEHKNQNYIKRTYGQLEKDLIITPADLKNGDQIQGEYEVGVYCPNGGRYGLIYRPVNGNFFEVSLNDMTSINCKADVDQYFEFYNYGEKANIEITFKAARSKVKLYALAVDMKNFANDNSTEIRLPTREVYSQKFSSHHEGGISNMIIHKESEFYCDYCKYIVLVHTDKDDDLELIVRKSVIGSLVTLEDAREVIGNLDKPDDNVHSYFIYVPPKRSTNGLELQIHSGNITLYFSEDPSFPKNKTSVIHQFRKDEFFRVSFPTWEKTPQHPYPFWTRRYLKLVGEANHSSYTMTYVQNEQIIPIAPMTKYKSLLSVGFKKSYFTSATENQTVQVKFSLYEIYNQHKMDYDQVRNNLADFVTFYHTKEYVYKTGSYETIENVKSDLFEHEVTYTFDSPSGIVVIQVENIINLPIGFNIELLNGNSRLMDKAFNTADKLSNSTRNITYRINVDESDQTAYFDFGECLQDISASYIFTPTGEKSSPMVNKLFDRSYSQRDLHLPTKGVLEVKISIPEDHLRNDTLGKNVSDTGTDDRPAFTTQTLYPTIFNFNFNLKDAKSKSRSQKRAKEYFHIDSNNGDVQLIVLDGSIRLKKVKINEIEKLIRDYNVFVNYTLYFSANAGILKHLSHCGTFGISDAEVFYQNDDYHIFSQTDLITRESYEREKKEYEEKKIKLPKLTWQDDLVFKPRVFGFNNHYDVIAQAKVFVFPRTDISTFPQGERFTLSYGKFEYSTSPLGYVTTFGLVLLVTFLGLMTVWLLGKYGIIKPLLNTKFFERMNVDKVADNLMIECIEYRRKNRKNQALQETSLDRSTDPLDKSRVDTEEPEADKSTTE